MAEATIAAPKAKTSKSATAHSKYPSRNAEIRHAEGRDACRFPRNSEESVSHAKDNYEKMKSAAEEATGVLEEHLFHRQQGRRRLQPQGARSTRTNTNAAFDFASEIWRRRPCRKWSSSQPRIRASSSRRWPNRARNSRARPEGRDRGRGADQGA